MSSIELWVASGLVDVSIKAALLALAAWVGMAACRVRSSTIRHRVWFLVLVGMLLLPALVNVLPGVSLPGWLYPKLPSAIATATDDRTPSSTIQQPAAGVPTMPDAPGPASASPPSEPEPAALRAIEHATPSPDKSGARTPPQPFHCPHWRHTKPLPWRRKVRGPWALRWPSRSSTWLAWLC